MLNQENLKGEHEEVKGVKGRRKALGMITNKTGQTTLQESELKTNFKKPKAVKRVPKPKLSRIDMLRRKYGVNKRLDMDEVDVHDLGSSRYCAEYISDVMATYEELEEDEDFKIYPFYMETQTDLNEKMRELLVDWLCQVHTKFHLSATSFFYGISILDRFLCKTNVKRDKLQLVGCAALWMACKYEEIFAPEIRDFVTISDDSFDYSDMIKAEKYITEGLKFKLGGPTVYMFIRRYLNVVGCCVRVQHIAGFIVEFIQQKITFLKYKQSLVAASVLFYCFLVEEYNQRENKENVFGPPTDLKYLVWDDNVVRVSGYRKEDILKSSCIHQMRDSLVKYFDSNYKAVMTKYSSEKHYFVAKLEYNIATKDRSEDERMELETE